MSLNSERQLGQNQTEAATCALIVQGPWKKKRRKEKKKKSKVSILKRTWLRGEAVSGQSPPLTSLVIFFISWCLWCVTSW